MGGGVLLHYLQFGWFDAALPRVLGIIFRSTGSHPKRKITNPVVAKSYKKPKITSLESSTSPRQAL